MNRYVVTRPMEQKGGVQGPDRLAMRSFSQTSCQGKGDKQRAIRKQGKSNGINRKMRDMVRDVEDMRQNQGQYAKVIATRHIRRSNTAIREQKKGYTCQKTMDL